MSDDEQITREKKPLSEAKLAAIERMKEGRKKSLEVKRKAKEEQKIKDKQRKKEIKMRVEEEMNAPTSLPIDDEEFMEELKEKALENPKTLEISEEEPVIINEEELECNKVGAPNKPKRKSKKAVVKEEEDDDTDELEVEIKQPKRRNGKKKVVINNYYEDEEDDENEEVNNFYQRRKPKAQPIEPEPEYEDEPEQLEYETPTYYPYAGTPSAMSGIRFV